MLSSKKVDIDTIKEAAESFDKQLLIKNEKTKFVFKKKRSLTSPFIDMDDKSWGTLDQQFLDQLKKFVTKPYTQYVLHNMNNKNLVRLYNDNALVDSMYDAELNKITS